MAVKRFADEKYVSWLKVSLSLQFAKEGLETFTDDEVKIFHSNIQKGLLPCTSGQSVHTCTDKHDLKKQWLKKRLTCKADNCDMWLTEIRKHHKNHLSPVEWDNSDISQLSIQAWECAKLYMPYGCKDQNSAEDADIAALLTLYLRCTHFKTFFTNVKDCEQIKDIRNSTMHSASMEVETPDMHRDTTKIIAFLEDPKHLLHVQGCKEAVDNIKKLLSNEMELSLNKELELRVLNSKLRHVKDDVDQLMTSFNDLNVFYNDLSDRVQTVEAGKASDDEKLNRIQSENQTMILEVDSTKNQLSEIKSRLEAFVKFVTDNTITGVNTDTLSDVTNKIVRMGSEMDKLKQQHLGLVDRVSKIETTLNNVEAEQEIQRLKIKDVEEEQTQQKQKIEEIDTTLKLAETSQLCKEDHIKGIQDHLISLYNKNCQTVPLYPLKPEWREHVEGLYVIPHMVVINPRGVDLQNTEHITYRVALTNRDNDVGDIRSIFYSEETSYKDIYVVGDSGKGKSSLCEYLVHLWVKAHSAGTQNVDNFMESFTFLFYISLREANSCQVEDMIRDQLDIKHEDISKLLSDNKCLIILDGLDEYSQISKGSRFGGPHIPARQHCANSTYVTTSRPWKVESLRKEKHVMDRQIYIYGLKWTEQKQLIRNVLTLLNIEKDIDQSVEDFCEEVKSQRLSEHMETPILLMQMLGLWVSGETYGSSQCEIYSKTVEMQLQFTEEIKEISEDLYTKDDATQGQLPACFKDLKYCEKYKSLLLKLSKLAYQQLFGDKRESALVFDHDQMKISGMNEIEMELCLKLGLLTQFKVIGTITKRLKYVSFVHKSHQEFLAAIYLSQLAEVSDLKPFLARLSDLDRALEIEKIFTFVSGMNSSVSCEIAKVTMGLVKEDPIVQQYRRSSSYAGNPDEDLVKRIQGMILDGIEEGTNNGISTPLLQLQDIWMKDDDRNFAPSRILPCTSALDMSYVKSLFVYSQADLSREGIWLHLKASNLQKLVLFRCGISEDMVRDFVCETGGDLQTLGLHFYGKDMVDFSQLSQENLHKILAAPERCLGLRGLTLSHEQMSAMSKHLSTRSYTELRLGWLACTDHEDGNECLSLDLSASRSISRLELNRLPLQKLMFCPEHLVWCFIASLPETVTVDATNCLSRATQLEVLHCEGYSAPALEVLDTTLHHLVNLEVIILGDLDLRGHDQLLSTPDLKKLKQIQMSSVFLKANHLLCIISSLPSHRVQIFLGHSDHGPVTITDDETDILQQIRDNPDINITKDKVKRDGDKSLISCFCFTLGSNMDETY